MRGERDLLRRFAEACPAVAGVRVGDVVVEAIQDLTRAEPDAAARAKRDVCSRLSAGLDLAHATSEWGWRELADRVIDRGDPSHVTGARLLPLPARERKSLLCTSTYENTARAVMRYASMHPDLTTLGAWRWRAEAAWRAAGGSDAFSLASLLRGDSRVVLERSNSISASFREGFAAIRDVVPEPNRGRLPALAEHLEGPVARSIGGFSVAFEKALDRLNPSAVAVGNEFAFTDRAALLLAAGRGLRTTAFAHGIFDFHYRAVPVLADQLVVWGGASARFVLESGLTPPERVFTVRPDWAQPPARERMGEKVVVFSQPVQFSRTDTSGYHDGIRRFCKLMTGRGVDVILKLHPLEHADTWKGVPARIVGRRVPPSSVLQEAFAVLLLDSSVIVDCLVAGVPALGIGWSHSTYGARFEREGWMSRASSPEEAVERVLALRSSTSVLADPLSGEPKGERERLRRALSGARL